ncbi:MAG: NUDIX hydrolase [Bacteroidetes bacterium]|nr:NUDIX hydrolase [Bacteroidota bacterium]
MQQWKTLKREVVFDHGKYLKIERHQIELPNGTIITDWPWIVSPDYALVMPVTDRGTIYLFRQTKYAVEGTSFAPVGGHIDSGEDPLTAAKRELREEMGCEAREWIYLGSFKGNGNHGGGTGHLFVAFDAHIVAEPQRDDLEEMELVELTIGQVKEKLLAGEVKVLGWIAMLALAILYIQEQQRYLT